MMPAEVCEYPDSRKIGAFGGGRGTRAPHDASRTRPSTTGRTSEHGACFPPNPCRRSSASAPKYPPEQRQSAVMTALAIAQDQHGVALERGDGGGRDGAAHAAGVGLRGRDLLQHVQPEAARQVQGHDLHQPAVRALRRRRSGRAPEAQVRRAGVQRDLGRRPLHGEGRRVHRRLRRRAGAAREQQAHVRLHDERQDRQAGRGAAK